jgi:sugar phosphate isomerase/epimerase
MKLGVFAVVFRDAPFEKVLDYIASHGVQAVEIGCGGYVGDHHCKPAQLLHDDAATERLKDAIASRGLTISALSATPIPCIPTRKLATRTGPM